MKIKNKWSTTILLLLIFITGCVSIAQIKLREDLILNEYAKIRRIIIEEATNNGFPAVRSEVKPLEINGWKGKLYFTLKTEFGWDNLTVNIKRKGDSFAIDMVGAGHVANAKGAIEAIKARLSELSAMTPSQVQNQFRPEYVIIDKQEPAYTIFVGIPKGFPKGEFEKIKSQASEIKEVEIVSWEKFTSDTDNYVKAHIKKNDYEDIQIVRGMVELIETYCRTPIGLTWNAGVAITYNDYQHAKSTYQRYLINPGEYERTRNRDPRLDPVNPNNHFIPLLGK
jgi:hypothetical protein